MIITLNSSNAKTLAEFKNEFSDAYNETQLISAFNNPNFFAVGFEDAGKIVGYITYSVSLDGADIETVFVLGAMRRKGIAKSLIEFCINDIKSKGLNKILLEVRRSNAPAISLYEKAGFKVISTRKKYYDGLEDALVMIKEL